MHARGNWNVGSRARLQMAPQVIEGQPSLLERRRRRARVAVHERQEKMHRVHLVVAEHLRLAVGVYQELAQRQQRCTIEAGSMRIDGVRVPGERLDRLICGRAPVGGYRLEDVSGRGLRRAALRCECSGPLEHIARVFIERDVGGRPLELRGCVSHLNSRVYVRVAPELVLCRATSYRIAAAAAEALKLEMCPATGRRRGTSPRSRTSRWTPSPSLPTTMHTGCVRSNSQGGISPRMSSAAHQIPARFTSAIADGMPDTCAIRSSSLAPELALTAAGDSGALRCSGRMAPSAPATSALRRIAPRFCGSMIPSSATSSVGCVSSSSFNVHTRRGLSSPATPWGTPEAITSRRSGGTTSIGANLASSSRRGS